MWQSAQWQLPKRAEMFPFMSLAAFFFYVVGVILRYAPHSNNDAYPNTFRWARRALSTSVALFFIQGLNFLFINKILGPKLTMISKMVNIIASIPDLYIFENFT